MKRWHRYALAAWVAALLLVLIFAPRWVGVSASLLSAFLAALGFWLGRAPSLDDPIENDCENDPNRLNDQIGRRL